MAYSFIELCMSLQPYKAVICEGERDLHRDEIQEKKKTHKSRPHTIKKMERGTYISMTTLNVNELNAPTKRNRLAKWIQKQDPYTSCLQETHFRPKDKYRLKVIG